MFRSRDFVASRVNPESFGQEHRAAGARSMPVTPRTPPGNRAGTTAEPRPGTNRTTPKAIHRRTPRSPRLRNRGERRLDYDCGTASMLSCAAALGGMVRPHTSTRPTPQSPGRRTNSERSNLEDTEPAHRPVRKKVRSRYCVAQGRVAAFHDEARVRKSARTRRPGRKRTGSASSARQPDTLSADNPLSVLPELLPRIVICWQKRHLRDRSIRHRRPTQD